MLKKARAFIPYLLVFFFLISIASEPLFSQRPATPSASDPDTWGFSESTSFANAFLDGTRRDRQLLTVAISYSHSLVKSGICNVRFAPEVIPAAFLSEPFFRGTNIQSVRSSPFLTEQKQLYGAGAKPVAFQFAFVPEKRVHPFIDLKGGFLYFNHNALAVNGAQFNFTMEGRAGVEYRSRKHGHTASLAYGIEHMSNAGTAKVNPGVDFQMIVLGFNFALWGKDRH